MTPRVRAAALLAVILALSGCAAGVAVSGENEHVRTIGVVDPRPRSDGSLSRCGEDSAITEGFQSADLPSSRLSYTLATSATPADVERIVDCLRRSLSSGHIQLNTNADG